jgi:hypothetical protein
MLLSYICFPSPSIIRIIKSRRMRWATHVARMEKRNAYGLLVEKFVCKCQGLSLTNCASYWSGPGFEYRPKYRLF